MSLHWTSHASIFRHDAVKIQTHWTRGVYAPPCSVQPLALILFIILTSQASAPGLFYGIFLLSFHDISALLHTVLLGVTEKFIYWRWGAAQTRHPWFITFWRLSAVHILMMCRGVYKTLVFMYHTFCSSSTFWDLLLYSLSSIGGHNNKY